MTTTKRIPTSYSVYSSIVHEHTKGPYPQELCVFESYTNPVDHGSSTIYTVWGFRAGNIPLVGAQTTWDSDWGEEVEGTRKTIYWLYAVTGDEE